MQDHSGRHPQRITVLDTPVDAVDMTTAVAAVGNYIESAQQPACVLAINPEKVYALRKDPVLKEFFHRAFLLLPDGIGVVWAGRLLLGKRFRRVAGADFMQRMCAVSAAAGHRVFVFGGAEEVNSRAVAELRRRYPGINIVGRANGFDEPESGSRLVEHINASRADILFVALGSPRQERWLQQHLPELRVKICQGVGGTLDVIAGNVRRAPKIFCDCGLEWLFRLVQQPSRVSRQVNLLRFTREVLTAKLRDALSGTGGMSPPEQRPSGSV